MKFDIDIIDCLIDTAERTTDLEGVYNDKKDWEVFYMGRNL